MITAESNHPARTKNNKQTNLHFSSRGILISRLAGKVQRDSILWSDLKPTIKCPEIPRDFHVTSRSRTRLIHNVNFYFFRKEV